MAVRVPLRCWVEPQESGYGPCGRHQCGLSALVPGGRTVSGLSGPNRHQPGTRAGPGWKSSVDASGGDQVHRKSKIARELECSRVAAKGFNKPLIVFIRKRVSGYKRIGLSHSTLGRVPQEGTKVCLRLVCMHARPRPPGAWSSSDLSTA
jgi:hypothetical protein